MKTKNTVIVLLLLSLMACNVSGFKEIFQNSGRITELLKESTECHEVQMVSYNITNGVSNVTYKLVGCEYEDLSTEADRLVGMLQDSVTNFCNIDHFNMVFVYKGEQQVVTYNDCEREEEKNPL
ncbi:MAG: hypothetical protein AAFX87_04820 [Bacteroidota bacterium]